MPSSGVPGSKHGIGTGVAPKKKDPYATAWRTYSKIAEELNLLNSDGSLYPISKDAILKYLRHQSKRIKSSNLHWYVNGLKKHQENLGFAWDDVRYDEQVVALLKELTVHPVSIDNAANGGSGVLGGMAGYHQGRPSISSHTAPIDNAKIASLSISSNPLSQQQHYTHSQQSYSASFGVGSKRYPPQPQDQYEETSYSHHSSRQYHQHPHHHQQQQYSDRIELPPPHQSKRTTPFHSAPIHLPSQHPRDDRPAPETPQPRYKGHSQALGDGSPAGSTSTTSSPMSSSEIQPVLQSPPSSLSNNGGQIKRKRHDLTSERLAHLVSPKSLEGGEDGCESNARRIENMDMDALEDMDEDHRERTPLKRHASTGTLRSQVRMTALTAISPEGHHFQQDYPVTTPSPGPRENESGGHFRWGTSESSIHSRLSPPGSASSSIGSASPASRSAVGVSSSLANSSSSSSNRHNRRPNGVVSSPIATVASAIASATGTSGGNIPPLPQQSSAIGGSSGSGSNSKTTVQFSEVVEYAQQLQTKYGGRCKNHPWGCVELSEDFHVELTIKMYMDWAGLVASGRLTMDEIPDLPEFRHPNGGGGSSSSSSNSLRSDVSPSSPSPTPGPSVVVGGILKRMASTPLTTTFGSFSLSQNNNNQQPLSPTLKSEDQSSDGRSILGQFTFEHEGGRGASSSLRQRQRSMSGSPPPNYGQGPKREGFISDSLMSRIGSPPPQHKIPSLPNAKASSSSGGKSNSGSSIVPPPVSARASARRMVSSPSLGQQYSFNRFSSPPLAPPPPVPSLPLSFAAASEEVSRRQQKNAYNSADSSPPSEDMMELSGDETPRHMDSMRGRTPIGSSSQMMHRRAESRDAEEEMDGESVFEGRVVQGTSTSSFSHVDHQYRRQITKAGAAHQDLDADLQVEEEEGVLTRRNGNINSVAHWERDHSRHREQSVLDEREEEEDPDEINRSSYDYRAPNNLSRQRPNDWNSYATDHRKESSSSSSGSRDRDSDEEMAGEKEKDLDRVEEVRRGIKSLQSSLSLKSHSHKGVVEGPANSNADPIATVEMTIVPKLQARTHADQRKHQPQPPSPQRSSQGYGDDANKDQDNNSNNDENASMMET
ncbi:hypothetical protein BGX26_001752 [Mortierella sp. AD094]|nr:hypothetical protein BGX26_001752 [Mortierella sp. AD094]